MTTHWLVDAHCHLDLFGDFAALRGRIERAQAWTFAVTNSPTVYRRNVELAAGSPFIVVGAGLHPQLVHERANELPGLLALIDETRFVGEVGLDYQTNDPVVRKEQRRVFAAVLERCNERADRVVTIHSRRAADDVVSALSGGFRGTAILHWFSGSVAALERGISAGCFFSVNQSMLNSEKGVKLIARIPRDRVLTESDGPFVKLRSGPAEPQHMASAAAALARLWRVSDEEARAMVSRNLSAALGESASR